MVAWHKKYEKQTNRDIFHHNTYRVD
jgi:hypothetical protein